MFLAKSMYCESERVSGTTFVAAAISSVQNMLQMFPTYTIAVPLFDSGRESCIFMRNGANMAYEIVHFVPGEFRSRYLFELFWEQLCAARFCSRFALTTELHVFDPLDYSVSVWIHIYKFMIDSFNPFNHPNLMTYDAEFGSSPGWD